ncbi:HugZ family pyridoxamine 5'-phosphate oxidase [Oceanomicrobium pacificus]|uniref:HugZ family protein n=1 Tax=Oceanomicrobium pacificus TaxID=2692916 RepID=A0A6B0TVT8_9RHOB|nr:pyridoxamine 5'-phosphate oxidase family protein [Oceanomicrobium pacificus]MXU65274.1 HugZ family protein [Oceanomicrobium pacificus]
MVQEDKTGPSLFQPVDDSVRDRARALIDGAPWAALGTLDPDGAPELSRVLMARDTDGVPVLLLSQLAPHFAALAADPRCALMVGIEGRGDPLAHARLMLSGRATRCTTPDPARRAAFLERHPKSALYIDFPDFAFWRVDITRATLNGGFGRAHILSPPDLLPDGAEGDVTSPAP